MNIRVDLTTPIYDGAEVVFRSPVDCSQVTGLIVYYQDNGNTASQEFAFADAHGNNVGDIDHLFAENVVVKVILDVTTGMAFVQNADTNAYLEGRFDGIANAIICNATGKDILLTDSAEQKLRGLKLYGKSTQDGTPNGDIKVTICGKNLANPWGVQGLEWSSVIDGSVELLDIGESSIKVKVVGKIHSVSIPVVNPITQFSTCWTINSNGGEPWKYVVRKSDGTPHGGAAVSGTTVDYGNITGGAYVDHMRFVPADEGNIPEGTEVTITGYINEGRNQAVQTPFVKPSFCTIPTPNGLNDGDYIDYGKGVRVENGVETPLTEEEMAEFAKLHTYYPTTTIFNDEGAGMEVSYVADTKNYIDKKFTELAAAIVANA